MIIKWALEVINLAYVLQRLSQKYGSEKRKIYKLLHERRVLFLLSMWSYRFNHVRKQEEINMENNKKEDRPGLKKITIVEVPYKIIKKYFAAESEKKDQVLVRKSKDSS